MVYVRVVIAIVLGAFLGSAVNIGLIIGGHPLFQPLTGSMSPVRLVLLPPLTCLS